MSAKQLDLRVERSRSPSASRTLSFLRLPWLAIFYPPNPTHISPCQRALHGRSHSHSNLLVCYQILHSLSHTHERRRVWHAAKRGSLNWICGSAQTATCCERGGEIRVLSGCLSGSSKLIPPPRPPTNVAHIKHTYLPDNNCYRGIGFEKDNLDRFSSSCARLS